MKIDETTLIYIDEDGNEIREIFSSFEEAEEYADEEEIEEYRIESSNRNASFFVLAVN